MWLGLFQQFTSFSEQEACAWIPVILAAIWCSHVMKLVQCTHASELKQWQHKLLTFLQHVPCSYNHFTLILFSIMFFSLLFSASITTLTIRCPLILTATVNGVHGVLFTVQRQHSHTPQMRRFEIGLLAVQLTFRIMEIKLNFCCCLLLIVGRCAMMMHSPREFFADFHIFATWTCWLGLIHFMLNNYYCCNGSTCGSVTRARVCFTRLFTKSIRIWYYIGPLRENWWRLAQCAQLWVRFFSDSFHRLYSLSFAKCESKFAHPTNTS